MFNNLTEIFKLFVQKSAAIVSTLQVKKCKAMLAGFFGHKDGFGKY